MRSPYNLIILLLLCAAALRSCVAVVTLEELLQYHEQQQNPDSNEEETETEDDGYITLETTTMTQQPLSIQYHKHRNQPQFSPVEDGSGQELDETTSLITTTSEPLTMSAQETEEPMTTRRMTTCCQLGETAGRKRHHCNPDNYMPRLFRHRNRGHNFKQTNKHPSQGRSQLDKCVSGIVRRLAEEFRTCCEEAYKRMLLSERGEEDHHGDRTHILEIPI